MVQGKTKSGFRFEIDEKKVMNNMELLDLLVDIESGDWKGMPRLLRMLLTEQQRKALYDTLRTEDGIVPADSVSRALLEMIGACSAGKK